MTKEQLEAAGLTPEIIKMLGLGVEQGQPEDVQRECMGDATVDWIEQAHSLIQFDHQHVPSWR